MRPRGVRLLRVDYDSIAPNYDRRYAGARYADAERALRAWLARWPDGRWLEVGCGSGHWLAALHGDGHRSFGLDRSAGMLALARTAAPRASISRGEADRLPYAASSFAALLCMNAFHHFPDKPGFVREAARVLSDDGELCVLGLDPHRPGVCWPVYDYFDGTREADEVRYPHSDRIADWLVDAGFVDCTTSVMQPIRSRLPAEAALASPMLRKDGTSQLALLSDEAYTAGIARLRAAATEGVELETNLELMAVVGRRSRG